MTVNTNTQTDPAVLKQYEQIYAQLGAGGADGTAAAKKLAQLPNSAALLKVLNQGGAKGADKNDSITITMGLSEPELGGGDIMLSVEIVRQKVAETGIKMSFERAQGLKEKRASNAEARNDETQKMLKKIEEAAKKAKIGKIFGWIAAGAMILAGAALCIAGGAGVALIVAGAATMTAMALQETGAMDAMMEGIAGFCADAFGLSDEDAQIMATCIVGALVIAASVAAGVAGGPMAGMAVFSAFASTLFTPENLEKMGVDKDAAPWVSMAIQITLAVMTLAAGGASAAGGTAKVAEAAAKGSKMAQMATFMAKQGALAGKIAGMSARFGVSAQQAASQFAYIAMLISAGSTVVTGEQQIESSVLQAEGLDFQANAAEYDAILTLLTMLWDQNVERVEEQQKEQKEGLERTQGAMDNQGAMLSQVSNVGGQSV